MKRIFKLLIFIMAAIIAKSYAFTLTSTAFKNNQPIPSVYTCDSKDLSPPLTWKDAPKGTQAFALVMHDPDAPMGTWYHWLMWNIPADTHQLAINLFGVSKEISVGKNSWGKSMYNGPCPPKGTHRYYFTLYALKANLPLQKDADIKQFKAIIDDYEIDKTTLMGTYTRRK